MTLPERRYRIGVLASGEIWPAWQLAALRALLATPGVELALVLDREGSGAPGGSAKVTALPADPLALVTAAEELGGVARLACEAAHAPQVAAHRLDVIWSVDALAPPPGLAAQTRGGVWALQIDEGDPRCLSALIQGRPTIPVRLLRHSERPGHAQVLEEGHFRNEPFSPALTRARVLYGSAVWPARRLRAWQLQGDAALAGPETVAAAARKPAPFAGLALRARQGMSLVRRAVESCFAEKWALGISDQPIASFLGSTRPPIAWLGEAAGLDFYADPFGIETAAGLIVLAEAYDHARGRGRIDVLCRRAEGTATIGRDVLPCDCHLSYPYLIEEQGEVYCVPETHQQRRIALYKADSFPERWTWQATLVEDFAGVDATVFRHEQRWWLLCGNEDDESGTKLYGFHADALRGPWRPHPLNPLKCDARSTRPGGTPFRHAGHLYRPAQDCSQTYGGAVVINRVLALTPTAFAETPVARLAPDPSGPYPSGLHTLSAVGGRTLIDGKRVVLSPGEIVRAGRHFVGRLRRHRASFRETAAQQRTTSRSE